MSGKSIEVREASVAYDIRATDPDVPPGYRRTDVGVIPSEWSVKTVGELGQIKTGPFGTLLKAAEYSGTEGVPLISVGEIGAGTIRILENTPRVPTGVVRRLPQYVLRTGDIVFGRKGAVDRSALVTENESGWFLGSDGISIRPSNKSYPPFLAWQFQRRQVQQWLMQNATGTTMASLNQSVLSRVKVPHAPLNEQRVIAEALSDVDGLLGSLDKLISKKRAIKQAAMQQLLTGKTRLPGFSGGWETKRLGDLGSTFGGLTGKTKTHFGHGEARYITFLNIMTNTVINTGALDSVVVNASESQNRVQRGDLFFNGSSETPEEVGMCAILTEDVRDTYLNSFCFGFRPREGAAISGLYLAYYFRSREGRELLKSLAQGATRYNLSKRALLAVSFPLPSEAEQTAIATVLSDMDAGITALEQRRDKARALKQGIMQQLLTGKTRLI